MKQELQSLNARDSGTTNASTRNSGAQNSSTQNSSTRDFSVYRVFYVVRCAVLCALFCLSGLTPACADTLFQVYLKAQERDAVLQAARFSLQAAQEKPLQAQAALLPTVALTASQQQARNEVIFGQLPPEQRPADSRNWNLQLSQPLYRPQN